MKLEDIYYFKQARSFKPQAFRLAEKVYAYCESDPKNKFEIQRRLKILSSSKGEEHLKKAGDFLAELVTFDELMEDGLKPKWLEESNKLGVKVPDIEIHNGTDMLVPVEVKHLNDPSDEHRAMYEGESIGGSVNLNYQVLIQKKVEYLVNDAKSKFEQYHDRHDKLGDFKKPCILYLFFTKSNNAIVADLVKKTLAQFTNDDAPSMKDYIESIANNLVKDTAISLNVRELYYSVNKIA